MAEWGIDRSHAGETNLYTLAYLSTATCPLGGAALQSLLEAARARNLVLGITGVLLYRNGRFVQLLEGSLESLIMVFESISKDLRHHDVRVIHVTELESRSFDQWTMGYTSCRDLSSPLPPGTRDTFDALLGLDSPAEVALALKEISLWFSYRTKSVVG